MMRIPVNQTVFHCRHGHPACSRQMLQPHRHTAVSTFSATASDSGNIYATTSGSLPPSPYFSGRFSNGPTYAEDLAGRYGFAAAPSLLGGTNHAFGGATAGGAAMAIRRSAIRSRCSALNPARQTARAVCRLGGRQRSAVPTRPGGHRFGVGRHLRSDPGDFIGGGPQLPGDEPAEPSG